MFLKIFRITTANTEMTSHPEMICCFLVRRVIAGIETQPSWQLFSWVTMPPRWRKWDWNLINFGSLEFFEIERRPQKTKEGQVYNWWEINFILSTLKWNFCQPWSRTLKFLSFCIGWSSENTLSSVIFWFSCKNKSVSEFSTSLKVEGRLEVEEMQEAAIIPEKFPFTSVGITACVSKHVGIVLSMCLIKYCSWFIHLADVPEGIARNLGCELFRRWKCRLSFIEPLGKWITPDLGVD